jgi:hypothetical protein
MVDRLQALRRGAGIGVESDEQDGSPERSPERSPLLGRRDVRDGSPRGAPTITHNANYNSSYRKSMDNYNRTQQNDYSYVRGQKQYDSPGSSRGSVGTCNSEGVYSRNSENVSERSYSVSGQSPPRGATSQPSGGGTYASRRQSAYRDGMRDQGRGRAGRRNNNMQSNNPQSNNPRGNHIRGDGGRSYSSGNRYAANGGDYTGNNNRGRSRSFGGRHGWRGQARSGGSDLRYSGRQNSGNSNGKGGRIDNDGNNTAIRRPSVDEQELNKNLQILRRSTMAVKNSQGLNMKGTQDHVKGAERKHFGAEVFKRRGKGSLQEGGGGDTQEAYGGGSQDDPNQQLRQHGLIPLLQERHKLLKRWITTLELAGHVVHNLTQDIVASSSHQKEKQVNERILGIVL